MTNWFSWINHHIIFVHYKGKVILETYIINIITSHHIVLMHQNYEDAINDLQIKIYIWDTKK